MWKTLRRLRFHRPYLEVLEARLPPGNTLGMLLGVPAWAGDPSPFGEDVSMASFPNSRSGTHFRETLFQAVSGETEFHKSAVPKPEFGNEVTGKPAPKVAATDLLDLGWLRNTAARTLPILSGPESSQQPALPNEGAVVAPPGSQRAAPASLLSAPAGTARLVPPAVRPPATASKAAPASGDVAPPDEAKIQQTYGRLPVSFEANYGQTDPQVRFLARGSGYTMFLTPTEAVMGLGKNSESRIQNPESIPDWRAGGVNPLEPASVPGVDTPRSPASVVRMQWIGANPNPVVTGQDQLPGIVNYFIGNDSARWHTDIRTFAKVEYQDVYPGINLVYYGTNRQLEYDFVVSPGADPRTIALNFDGADKLELDAAGDLVVHAGGSELRQHKPVVYQEVNGTRREVAGNFVLQSQLETQHSKLITFAVGAYDATLPLVIDPALGYSSFLGGSGNDPGFAIAVDSGGSSYVTGFTSSTDFPTQNPFHNQLGGSDDAFVTKLNATGTAKVYSTYLGGTDSDEGFGIAVDSAGSAYVAGRTSSTNFPVGPGFQTGFGGFNDAFVSKLSPAGNTLVYSSYLGGTSPEQGNGIAVDAAGNAYVTGFTDSADFPTSNGFQSVLRGIEDAFVTKVSADGTTKVYSTYLGGSDTKTVEAGNSIAVDAAGHAYVTGTTPSTDFPLVNAFQGFGGGLDAFVTEFAAAGNSLVYSTYLGGGAVEAGRAIAVGLGGEAYLTGVTTSTDFPTTPGAFDTTHNGGTQDAFVTKVAAGGTTKVYSTYLGGNGFDFGNGIAVNGSGNVFVAGETNSTNFPTKAPLQGFGGGFEDADVTKLTPDGAALVYSTYLGGNNVDTAHGIAVDAAGNAYLAGLTNSADFPTKDPFQTLAGQGDAFITRILPGNPTSLPTDHWTAEGPAPISNGQVPGNGAVSGRIAAIAPHPTDPKTIYVGAAGGGVWKTTDAGTSWTPLSDPQDTLVTGALAVAPSSPTTLYAGTGEACNSPDNCFYGRGVLKSRNAGGAWKLYPGNPSQNEFDRRTIAKLAVDPTDANVVYAAVGAHGTNSPACGGTGQPSCNTGIWKSSNGGRTWTNTSASITTTDDFTDVALDPSSPQTLYGAVGAKKGATTNGLYKSADGGASWNPVGGGLPSGTSVGKTRVAVAPSNPQVLYVAITGSAQAGSAKDKLLLMAKSSDGGASWTSLPNTPDYMDGVGFYASALAVDPTNANVVYAGSEKIFQTTDGGATWKEITAGANGNGVHADHQAFAFDANGKLLDGNDGGVWRLDNANPTSIQWTDLNTNLQITQFVGIALDPVKPVNTGDPAVAYGGSQDNGAEKFTGSASWTHIADGDGGFVRVDPSSPQTVYHTFQYPLDTPKFLQRSDDGGTTWLDKTNGINQSDPGHFYIPYVMDPSNPARLILGTNRVYETTNRGDSWTAISAPNAFGWTTAQPIDSLEVAPGDPKTIYATAAGKLFETSDGGINWNDRSILSASDHVNDLLVDPLNKNTVYAVRDQFDAGGSAGHVFRTTTGGNFWSDVSGNLPDLPVHALALDPRSTVDTPPTLYIGTDKGVFFSTNFTSGSPTWQVFQTGLPNVQVRELAIDLDHNVLAAGTFGRGLWEIGLKTPGSPPGPPAPPDGGRTSATVLSQSAPAAHGRKASWPLLSGDVARPGRADATSASVPSAGSLPSPAFSAFSPAGRLQAHSRAVTRLARAASAEGDHDGLFTHEWSFDTQPSFKSPHAP
jgi:hypothetical protein